jgi:hypothetical protein
MGDFKMARLASGALAALGMGLGVIGGTLPAVAGSDEGNVQVRVLATVVDPDTDATVTAGGLAIAGANADVSTEVIPALTLSITSTNTSLLSCSAASPSMRSTTRGPSPISGRSPVPGSSRRP